MRTNKCILITRWFPSRLCAFVVQNKLMNFLTTKARLRDGTRRVNSKIYLLAQKCFNNASFLLRDTFTLVPSLIMR